MEARFLGCTARSVVTVFALLDEIQAFDDEVTVIHWNESRL